MFWLIVGPAIVVILGLVLVLHHPRLGSVFDFVFAGAALLAIGARYLDRQKPAEPGGDSGDLASTSPTKYAVVLLIVVAALFAFGHFVAPRVF